MYALDDSIALFFHPHVFKYHTANRGEDKCLIVTFNYALEDEHLKWQNVSKRVKGHHNGTMI